MYQFSVIVTMLSTLFLSLPLRVLAAPLPFDQPFDKRDVQSGRGTWFYDGLGACGYRNSDSDPIVAISAQIYGTGANCDQWVQVTNTANGKSAFGMMRDECQSCDPDDLDLSIGLFEQLDNLNTGVLSITWDFMPMGWSPPS